MNKSTKRRLITSIICFTACASLVGVGFSLWTAGNGSASASGEGDLVTDDFFAKINIESISVDPFCPSGFLKDYNEESATVTIGFDDREMEIQVKDIALIRKYITF